MPEPTPEVTRCVPADGGPGATAASAWRAVAAWLLLVAVGIGMLRQGGYPAMAQAVVGAGVAGAVLAAAAGRAIGPADLRSPPLLAGAALAGWALADGALHAAWSGGVRPALLVAAVVLVATACRRLYATAGDLLLGGLLGVGCLVAATGWLGVVAHRAPWGWPAQGVWRASSTLTYPNATGAVLVLLALVALGRLADRPRSATLAAAATALLAGAGATLSRAALLGAVAGFAVLVALRGRLAARAAAAPAAGAAVALAGLLPSLPEHAPSRPLLPTAALVVGLGLGVALPRSRRPGRPAAALAAMVLAAVVLATAVLGIGDLADAVRTVAHGRLTGSSADRAGGAAAALRLLAGSPLTGAGPGLPALRWTDPQGGLHVLRYAHDEYLQVGAELGVVGLLLLAALLVTLARLPAWRAADPAAAGPRAGVAAGLVALAVHSGADFLWHLPALPLAAATLLGLASGTTTPATTPPTGRVGQ